MLFKSWEKIVAEHKNLEEMMIELDKYIYNHITEWNSKKAPLLGEEKRLRDELVRSTERERKEIEAKIDKIVDEQKLVDEILDKIEDKEQETRNKIYIYMKENFTEKELKKARTHGWGV